MRRATSGRRRILVDLARRHLGDPSRLEALDVGCGPGETDAFLEGAFADCTGVDLSEPMVRRAAERNPWAPYAAYEKGDPLPFDDASLDVTFAICVLHHVPLVIAPLSSRR